MFYPRLDRPATLESKKFSHPRRRFPESRFSQAGKASEGTPRWIRGFPRLPPSPAMSPMGVDSRRHRSARDQAPADERDSGRFAPSVTSRPRATASTGRRPRTSPDPRSILPAPRGKCRRPSTPLQLRKAIPQGLGGRVCPSVSGCRALPRRRRLTCPPGLGRFLTECPESVQDRQSKSRGHADRLRVLNPSSIRPRLPPT